MVRLPYNRLTAKVGCVILLAHEMNDNAMAIVAWKLARRVVTIVTNRRKVSTEEQKVCRLNTMIAKK